MNHQMFNVKGMTCESCVAKITDVLSKDAHIKDLKVTLNPPQIHFNSEKKFSVAEINAMLAPLAKYSVKEISHHSIEWTRYVPLFLLFGLSAGVPALNAMIHHTGFEPWMYQFMGVTLIALAYFKFLDLPKFAEAFSTYDPIAMKFYNYGYIYPFFELAAGIGFSLAIGLKPLSGLVILILLPTTVGVIKALRANRKFQCACLGTAFNLPLTKVTIVENVLMIAMSAMILAG